MLDVDVDEDEEEEDEVEMLDFFYHGWARTNHDGRAAARPRRRR
jgi:hypothetical protein